MRTVPMATLSSQRRTGRPPPASKTRPLSPLVTYACPRCLYALLFIRCLALFFILGFLFVGSKDIIPSSQIAHLTSLNFIVLIPNYRLCPQISARDGAFADTRSALEFACDTLPSLLQSSHGIAADGTRVAAMGNSSGGTLALHLVSQPRPPQAIAAFYPSLYISEPDNTAHKPYAGFPGAPDYTASPDNEDALYNRPSNKQVSAFPLALPGTPPKPRNLWQLSHLRKGTWIQALQPDGDFAALDPCRTFKEVGEKWSRTVFVQGDKDDLPGSGIAYVERAVRDLEEAGARKVRVEKVVGAGHMFDMLPGNAVGEGEVGERVMRALEFLRENV